MRPTTKIRSGDMAKSAQMTVSDEVAIEISEMNKWFGSFHVLIDINLTVNRG